MNTLRLVEVLSATVKKHAKKGLPMNGSRLAQRRRTRVAVGVLLLLGCQAAAAWPDDFLSQLEQEVIGGTYGNIDSLLISHDGVLLFEEYYNGYDADGVHNLFSATKSVTSALVGIAIDSGAINSVGDRMLDYFPDYAPANMDARKEAITLEDMLKMQAGFQWQEWGIPYTFPGNGFYDLQHTDRDWMEYLLDLEMSAAPGTEFTYNTGVSILLSRVLSESVGTSAHAFADDTLFADLGIGPVRWDETPQGETITGGELWLRPLDMVAFGQIYLNNGYWRPEDQVEGKQVVSSQWVAQSTRPYVNEGMPGRDRIGRLNYGYQWWRFQDDAEEVSELSVNDVFFAWGFEGQFIFVVPHLDLVVVTTGSHYQAAGYRFVSALPDFIFPAIQEIQEINEIEEARGEALSHGPSAIYTVVDNDFDDQGDTHSDASSKPRRSVGENDTSTNNSIVRLVAKFDLPGGHSVGRLLESATLRFFLEDIVGSPAGPVSLFHSVDDAGEVFPSPQLDYQDSTYTDTLLDLVTPTDEGGRYFELDVTDLVLADYAADGHDPISAFRLQISELVFFEDDESGKYRFTMPGAEANHPELVLTFIPEPSTRFLSAIAMLGLLVRRGWHRKVSGSDLSVR